MVFAIPPLISGGVMLSYRCTNACRHCLYRCSPAAPADFMSESRLDQVFAALAAEPRLHGVHLAGGEATLDWDRLEAALAAARRHGVAIDYLETNGYWCTDAEAARQGFRRLRAAGLNAVLLSASLFHLEFIPFVRTRLAVAAAREALGAGNVIVWTPDVYQLIAGSGLDENRVYPLRDSCSALGLHPERGDLWRLHSYLTPGGRAAEVLGEGLPRRPARAFAGEACVQTLTSVGHFHVDPEGNLFTGKCPGLAAATVEDFHPALNHENAPLTLILAEQGPVGLLELAEREAGFAPDPAGYIGKCQLCLAVRCALFETGKFHELRGQGFYQ